MYIRPNYNYRHRTLNHKVCCIYKHDFTTGELRAGQKTQVLHADDSRGSPLCKHSHPLLVQEVGLNAGFWRRWAWSNFEMTEGTKYWNTQATAGARRRTQELEKQRCRGDAEVWRGSEELGVLSLRSDVGTDFQKRGFYKLSPFDIVEELIADAKEQLWSTCLLPGHLAWPPQLWLTLRTMELEPSYPEVTRSQKDNNSHQTVYKDSITHYLPCIYSQMGIL